MPPFTGTRDPIPAGSVALADLAFDPGTQAELDAAIAALSSTYGVVPYSAVYNVRGVPSAQTNWATYILSGSNYTFVRVQSSGAQNATITFAPQVLAAGTWQLDLIHLGGTDKGIYTVEISTDGAAFTAINASPYNGSASTIDGYQGSATGLRSGITGIVIGTAGRYWIRLTMATKNASSSSYVGAVADLTMTRTGA